ncbi:MAG: hypothetical protein QG604_390 [Candidatus Dependentiae bacterium]|nr:hypothetical protein [Candidatus Dependentiae bacterium]
MREALFFAAIIFLCLLGCGRKKLSLAERTPNSIFTTTVAHDDLTIHARLCDHDEIMDYFSCGEDFYHYYYLIQLRLCNQGYIRYTLQSEECSFFVPPSEMLRTYTHYGYTGGGVFFSFLNAMLFLPVYAISMLKSAVETPPYLAQPDIVVPRSFVSLSLFYAAIVLVPLILGGLWERSCSSYAFHEANRYILTQRQQFSCGPFSTENIFIFTPRAGFKSPCEIALYNHKTHSIEKVSLPVKLVW